MARVITATEATRSFRRMLDDLEHDHETVFVIERHGEAIARIGDCPYQGRPIRSDGGT